MTQSDVLLITGASSGIGAATAKAAIKDLLTSSTYAALKVFNIVDWMGEGPDEYKTEMLACQSKDGYVTRMKQKFGLVSSSKKKKDRKRKKK